MSEVSHFVQVGVKLDDVRDFVARFLDLGVLLGCLRETLGGRGLST